MGTIPISAFLRFDPKGPIDLLTFIKTGRTFAIEDYTKQFTVESFTILFFKYIFCLFGLPDGIISDKDNLFTNKF